VKFLIDENLSPRICILLIAGGHHATHIHDYGTANASDPQVLANLTPAVSSALGAGAFVVLTPRAVRVRHLSLP
jgi:hypothetical protein